MAPLPHSSDCPYCRQAMRPSAMRCSACETEVRGEFRPSLFGRLDAQDQELLEQYLLANFSIKTLANRSDMGYVAIRSRLDRLIERYEALLVEEADRGLEEEKTAVLRQVASGKISTTEALEQIAALRNGNKGGEA